MDRPERPNLDSLPPFLRVLLVTDGTVTRSLEAYFREGIDVDVLTHVITDSDQAYPHIGVVRGEPIVRRCVILRGRRTRVPYALATSVISSRRLSPNVSRELVEKKQGIGELLLAARLRTYREILEVQRITAGASARHLEVDPEENVVVRQYTINHAEHPSIQIEELFAVCRYETSLRQGGLEVLR